MSVVFRDAIVVVDRLAICALDSELMKDVISIPRGVPHQPTPVRANHTPVLRRRKPWDTEIFCPSKITLGNV
jgi:hypothetical protein